MALSTARTLPALRDEYTSLYAAAQLRPERMAAIDARVNTIAANRARYEAVAAPFGVPWYVLGIIQSLEGGGFNGHLHNGDPLTARTTHVPAGRPTTGNPPFTWDESAVDAIRSRGWTPATDWTLPGTLFQLERYNGFAYRDHNMATPYLWSGTTLYTSGKITSDGGAINPSVVSQQIGGAALLKRMEQRGLLAPQGTSFVSPWVPALLALAFAGAAAVIVLADDSPRRK